MKTKSELINNLAKVISEHNSTKEEDKKVQNRILELYKEKRLPLMTVGLVFKGDKTLTSLFEIELGIWCIGLYEATSNSLIKPDHYFSDKEIYEIQEYINQDNSIIDVKDIILHNVIKKEVKGKTFYYCPFVNYSDIFIFNKSSLVTYNYKTQREAKLTRYQGKIITQENVNLDSVEDIANLVEVDELPPSMITFNIIPSAYSNQAIHYYENGDLKITPSMENKVFVNIIDGYHRTLGIMKGYLRAKNKNQELKGGMMILVTTYSVEDAQSFIQIQNKQNAIQEEQTKAFVKDEYNEFAKSLNYAKSSLKNKMYDKIYNTLDEVVLRGGYTTINVLHDGFKLSNLKFSEPYEVEEIYKPHFINTFNTIIGYYLRKYKNDELLLKQETIVLEPNVFIAYICIGKELLEREDSKELLRNLLENKINLNRDAYNWESIDMFKKNPRSYKKIYDHFEKIIKEEIR